ncbi:DUF6636 domain-containing protein [Pseudooceanicola sp. C21-150M6]|uniref:DUF6636 domain-containing protein n=1 Tax=Pseudooceanicola sp. C21-150M6 TaxID=3434355 RepID=UPI003D7FDE94
MRMIALLFLLLPGAALADGYGFRTPSGNIYCNGTVIDGAIDCNIVEFNGAPLQPKPGNCNGIWGHTFEMDGTGPARMSCSSYRPRKSTYTNIAGYGQSADFGPIRCTSEKTGLTCRNQSGHGFFLSRRQQGLF